MHPRTNFPRQASIRAVVKNPPANEPIGQLGELAIFRLQLRFLQQNSQRYKESLRHHIVKGNMRHSLRNGCSIQIVSSAANSHPNQNERKCCLTPSSQAPATVREISSWYQLTATRMQHLKSLSPREIVAGIVLLWVTSIRMTRCNDTQSCIP